MNNNISAMSRQELLRGIQMASFAVKEAQLFLDTHPTDAAAIAYFNKYNKKKEELTAEYSRRFGPLSLNNYQVPADTWEWVKGPWPWELEDQTLIVDHESGRNPAAGGFPHEWGT